MIFDHRRLLTLGALAALIVGTAVASRRIPSPPPTRQVSAEVLLERAQGKRKDSTGLRTQSTSAEFAPQDSYEAKSNRRHFTIYRNEAGEVACRLATADEIREREGANSEKSGLRRINHFELDKTTSGQSPAATNLVIVLRATQQLQQNAAATAAFNRAAQNWESVIMSPITIYIDVDFGATNFGDPWPAQVLGATGTPSGTFPYQFARSNLIAQANSEGNATKQGIFNALPSTTVPTDLGDGSGVDVSDSIARAIGLLPPTAQPSDDASQIAFNSNFTFDFDPSNGITANAVDFDAVATHEIGHALGFDSDAGMNLPKPAVWDLYRFRTGTTSSTFPTAQRILTVGGAPDPLQYDLIPGNPELGLSTGGPTGSNGSGGDGWQSSHWKHVATCGGAIGIMDPAIPDGCRRTITSNDSLALTSFGYNLTNNNLPPAASSPTPPANDNFANAQTITGCSGNSGGSTFGATSEAGEPSHDPSDATSLSPSHTIWYQWQAPFSTATTINTLGSDFDTIVAVYTGNSVGSLTRIAFNDDQVNGVVRTSNLTFNPTAGTTYKIAVDGWGRDSGTVKLNWNGCLASTPTPTPTPNVSPAPVASPTPPTGQAVSFQINPAHTGWQMDGLTPPLMPRWSRNMGFGVNVSYPLIIGGRVFVMLHDSRTSLSQLRALDEATGADLWNVNLAETKPWVGHAYDSGRIFATRTDGFIQAVDAATGATAWTKQLPGNLIHVAYPVANEGTVFVQASGSNGILYALAVADGAVKWTANTTEQGPTSVTVSSVALYEPFSCGHLRVVSPATGAPYWSRTNSCSGGNGGAAVLSGGRLYLQDDINGNVILDASTAVNLGSYPGLVLPAFDASTGYYVTGSLLARDLNTGAQKWSFNGDGSLITSPIVDNGYVYVGSQQGNLYALNASTGQNVWTGKVGAAMVGGDIGLAAGEGLLVVPASTLLVAYQHAPLIDTPDFFVKQQYLDFLNRPPDQSGLDFWTNQITQCGSDTQCIEAMRVNVSAAFFLSIEFQQTGNLVYKMYKAGFGNLPGKPVAVDRTPFITDTRQIQSTPAQVIVGQGNWQTQLETNKQAFALAFVQRAAFQPAHASQDAGTYVSSLFANAGVTPTGTETSAAISSFNGAGGGDAGRASALRSVAESNSVSNKLFNEAFVLMQYFGYLQRNPYDPPESTLDYQGYNFWLNKLNQFNGNYINAEMVKAFLASSEYRQRFGP